MEAGRQREAEREIDDVHRSGKPGWRLCELQDAAEDQIKERRLAVKVEEALEQPRAQQLGVDDLGKGGTLMTQDRVRVETHAQLVRTTRDAMNTRTTNASGFRIGMSGVPSDVAQELQDYLMLECIAGEFGGSRGYALYALARPKQSRAAGTRSAVIRRTPASMTFKHRNPSWSPSLLPGGPWLPRSTRQPGSSRGLAQRLREQ
jgi:hypothetical protein